MMPPFDGFNAKYLLKLSLYGIVTMFLTIAIAVLLQMLAHTLQGERDQREIIIVFFSPVIFMSGNGLLALGIQLHLPSSNKNYKKYGKVMIASGIGLLFTVFYFT